MNFPPLVLRQTGALRFVFFLLLLACAGPSGSAARDRFGSVTLQNMYVSQPFTEGRREGEREGERKKIARMNQLTTGCVAGAGAPPPPPVPSS